MENVDNKNVHSSHDDNKIKSEKIGAGDETATTTPQGAVDIVDFYATTSDARKQSECSDSSVPILPSRKISTSEIISSANRKDSDCGSETGDQSPPSKPSRRISQCSNNNRKFSVCSNSSASRTPKKVSFSDELPITDQFSIGNNSSSGSDAEQTIRLTSDYLETLKNAMEGNNIVSSEEGSASTTPIHELSTNSVFPNSRKISIHSERSIDVSPTSILKSIADTPMELFLDQERRNSTSSLKSNFFFLV